jgi:hypothetical protein
MRTPRSALLFAALSTLACTGLLGEGEATPDTGADASEVTGHEDGVDQTTGCADYLECLESVDPDEYENVEGVYGKDGSCWQSTREKMQDCDAECLEAYETLIEAEGTCEPQDTDDTGATGGAELSTDQPSLAFGKLDLYASAMKQLVVTNTGTEALTVSAAASGDTAFVLGGNLTPPRTLDPGEYRVIEVTFTPTTQKSYSTNLVIESDDPGSPTTRVALTGEGIDSCDVCSPLIEVDTGGTNDYAITDFFSIDGADDGRTITVGNDGDEDLIVSDVSVENDIIATCGTFSISGWTGSKTVAPGKTTSFNVTYRGDANSTCVDISDAALGSNVLHIISNDPVEDDYVIELQGSSLDVF